MTRLDHAPRSERLCYSISKDTTLASASVTPSTSADSVAAAATMRGRGRRRRQTAHLKRVPETRELREQIRQRCDEVAARLDKSHPLSKDAMESLARATLDDLQLPEGYVGWTMVMLASAFWRDQVAAVPPSRRLFLLPHCLKHTEQCTAHYNEFGLDCRSCGACSIGDFRTIAQQLGYRVLVAEGSPIVMKIILSGYVDAIVGVACLNVLEKAIDKVLLAGIPCIADAAVVEQLQGHFRGRRLGAGDDPVAALDDFQRHAHLHPSHACRVRNVRTGGVGSVRAATAGWSALVGTRRARRGGARTHRRHRSDRLRLPGQGRASTRVRSLRWPSTMR